VAPSPPLFVPAPINNRLWHVPFNRVDKLPEQLVEGREDVSFGYEFAIQGGNLPRRRGQLLRPYALQPRRPARAAFLIVIVFAGFAAGEALAIKQLGVGLAIAVLVDATIVRTLLVPATMKMLGERNWWAPAPLRRLHQRFGLHEAPSTPDTTLRLILTDPAQEVEPMSRPSPSAPALGQ
jgi:hypothetical protein